MYGRWSRRENLKKLNFWQIMGNHDHRGNQTAQVDYMYQIPDSNFKMPEFYYTLEIEKSKDLSMKLIMIDTMIMMNAKEVSKLPDADIRDAVHRSKTVTICRKSLQIGLLAIR